MKIQLEVFFESQRPKFDEYIESAKNDLFLVETPEGYVYKTEKGTYIFSNEGIITYEGDKLLFGNTSHFSIWRKENKLGLYISKYFFKDNNIRIAFNYNEDAIYHSNIFKVRVKALEIDQESFWATCPLDMYFIYKRTMKRLRREMKIKLTAKDKTDFDEYIKIMRGVLIMNKTPAGYFYETGQGSYTFVGGGIMIYEGSRESFGKSSYIRIKRNAGFAHDDIIIDFGSRFFKATAELLDTGAPEKPFWATCSKKEYLQLKNLKAR